MRIPMVDLAGQYQMLREDLDKAAQSVLASGHYILGEKVALFEQQVADYFNVEHAIAVSSGTDALHLALEAVGIGQGDEVITTSFTFIGTAEAISYTGATPVFIDICPESYNLDCQLIEAAITPKTKAIVAVHLFGQAADLDTLMALCDEYDLELIEDCAQSFGAQYGTKKTGTFGTAGCLSFYPSKNLGGFGDGGMVICRDDKIADRVKLLRNHAMDDNYRHEKIGYNRRMDALQAALLSVKLPYVDAFNRARRNVAQVYTEKLKGLDLITPVEGSNRYHVYHQYTIRSDRRIQIRQTLSRAEIASAVYYPVPLHKQKVYLRDTNRTFPISEQVAGEVLSLPVYPELLAEQIEEITYLISKAV